ncbi:MAG: PEP-CTERM sorting domain-containing protein [Bryobacteraceae bacterium]
MRRIIFGGLLAAVSAMAGPMGYVINFSGQFGTMDLTTGAFTPLGPGVASNSAGGLAGAPGGPFYGVDASGNLLRFSTSGAVTTVGDTGTGASVGPNGISVLGGLTTGTVYALDFSNRLFSVNTSTAALSNLGTLALPPAEQQYDGNMVTSLNGDGQFLYYTLDIVDGPNAISPTLYRIDPSTLAITSHALTGLSGRIIGSGFVGGLFYGFTEVGQIIRIDKLTGATTVVGMYDSGVPPDGGPPFTGVFGVVGTPEPGTVWLSMGGLMALAARRFRRA